MTTAAIASTTTPPAGDTRRTTALDRWAGAAGITFVVLLVVQNLLRASAPGFGAPPHAVATYFAGHRVAVLVPLALFPVGMVAIASFAAGVWSRASGVGRWWAHLGAVAVAILAGLFGLVNVTEVALAADARALIGSPGVVQALWAVHAAAFGFNLVAIALALVGLSQAGAHSGLVPGWMRVLALPGAGCLFVAAVFSFAIAEGSSVLYLGFAGFVVWGVFLVTTGLSLLRGGSSTPASQTRML